MAAKPLREEELTEEFTFCLGFGLPTKAERDCQPLSVSYHSLRTLVKDKQAKREGGDGTGQS